MTHMDKRVLTISIVIPAYNEEELLAQCLASVIPQARERGAEVILVDNNSTDRTAAIARNAGVRVVREPRQGVVFAIATGVAASQGAIIAMTDADTIVAPDWLAVIARSFLDPSVIATTGPVRYKELPWMNMLHRFTQRDLWGANMAIWRLALDRIGGIDCSYSMAWDVVLGRALSRVGTVQYNKQQRVTTSCRRIIASPVRESLRVAVNYCWMGITGHPLWRNFSSVRVPKNKLKTRKRKLVGFTGSTVALGIAAYLMAWPSANVFGAIVTHAHVAEKMVALTFDDGPNSQATRTIVDILKQRDVPATFFEVGKSIAADTATSKYVADNGFSVENHSWDHSLKIPVRSERELNRELTKTTQEIENTTGEVPHFFRPPHGLRSPQLLLATRKEHLRIITWSVDPKDYSTNDGEKIYTDTITDVHSGSIVLLHDGVQDGPHAKEVQNRQGTITALPQIIDTLRQRGYVFVSLDKLLAAAKAQRAVHRSFLHLPLHNR